jgi:hypothetical protein
MNQHKLTSMLIGMAMVFFLISCGGNGSGEKSSTDTSAASTDTSAATMTAPAPVNTVITTPTNMVVVTHKVKNFAKWMDAYTGHDSARLAYGLHDYVISRGFNDSNMVMVALKADDMAKAKAFTKDPSLKKAMDKGGVVGPPMISFYVAAWQDTATLAPGILRSRTTFTVKDWDAFVKSFDDGKQERIDNGIVTRVVGHDADDNKKVTLITAVTDTAKAFAYYKSDALKKRREAAGVIGEPKRFLFQIVKRY